MPPTPVAVTSPELSTVATLDCVSPTRQRGGVTIPEWPSDSGRERHGRSPEIRLAEGGDTVTTNAPSVGGSAHPREG